MQAWVTAHSGGWTAHDLRRTFATRINGMGAAPHVVEKLLNHTLPGLMATYNRAEYLPERQQALEAWSQWLTGLVGKPHANSGEVFPATVIPLRQAAVAA